jgi:hypothetical protein
MLHVTTGGIGVKEQSLRDMDDTSQRCVTKRRLLADYESKAALFSASVTALNAQIGTSSKGEYEAMRRTVDEARVNAEEVRLKLERHTAEHGC